MKYILCQPAIKRFEWELEVCIARLQKLGINSIILLFTRHDDVVPRYLHEKYGVETHVYEDKRKNKSYIPSVKPYLFMRYLEEDKERENDTYFYMDSDVIFREKITDIQAKENVWLGSNCDHYLNYDYIKQCRNGERIIKDMADIVGINANNVKGINENSIGAQYVMKKPTASYFKKVYEDSNKLWNYIKNKDTNFQKWVVEMISTLWNMVYFDIKPKSTKELEFSWPTDDIERYYQTKILHNAGVKDDHQRLFFKGKYVNRTPFRDSFEHVNKNKASIKYVEAIKEVLRLAKYEVLEDFRDLEEDKEYFKGDPFPKPANKKVTKKRLKELSSKNNKAKRPLIKEIKEQD